MNFASDTAAAAHPAILAALAEANGGPQPSYGADSFVAAARAALCEVFETELDVWFTASGTAANALALAAMCPPTHAILCHEEAHIERDERGAPEFFSGGAKLSLLPGDHARIDPATLNRRLAANDPNFVHETPLRVLSLSNLTESGAAYDCAAVAEMSAAAHRAGLLVHLDGARFANVVAASGRSPAELSWKAGVDVMSFGATKNGALGCEAILLFGEARALHRDLLVRAKRSGHMPPKMRFLGAQMSAYLKDGLWLDLASTANQAARSLAEALRSAGASLRHPVDGNEVFADLAPGQAAALKAAGARFLPWIDGSHRFVCSWSTRPDEVAALAGVIAHSAK